MPVQEFVVVFEGEATPRVWQVRDIARYLQHEQYGGNLTGFKVWHVQDNDLRPAFVSSSQGPFDERDYNYATVVVKIVSQDTKSGPGVVLAESSYSVDGRA